MLPIGETLVVGAIIGHTKNIYTDMPIHMYISHKATNIHMHIHMYIEIRAYIQP